MIGTNNVMPGQDGSFPLQQLLELEHELEIAMDAIAHNALVEFEQSLWRQEMLCQGLKRALPALVRSPEMGRLRSDLHQAAASLLERKRGFEALVGRSKQNSALLQDLCGLYLHLPLSASASETSSLSCEA